MRCSAAGGGGDARRKRVYGWRGGAASFRGADTAKVCNNVGLVVVDGVSECSPAVAATQGVSGILRARQGLRHQSLAATSAFDATSTRHVSAKPQIADESRGVDPLKNTSINKQSFASVHKMTLRGKSLFVSDIHVGCIFQQKAAHVCMTLFSRIHQGSGLTEKQIN